MLAVVISSAAGASHPAVAVWFALGAAGLAAAVVAMAWSVQARQIRLAELLVRRQFLVIAETGAAGRAPDARAGPLPVPFGWTAAGGVVGRRRGFGVAVS